MTTANPAVRNYAIVTLAYWADTLADGAIRMLVLFYFYQLGYSAFQVASLFLFYEVFGIITNFCGGYLASRFGLKSTLFMGLGTQLIALSMLALMPANLLTVAYVMASQALSGIAKDLTKMSSKSAVKLIAGDGEGRLYRWVALLTGSKNALKGVGFFLGSLLLSLIGFQNSVITIAIIVALALLVAAIFLRGGLGEANKKTKFRHLISRNRSVNLLSVARVFLFGARDVWFVVALPVFLSSVLGWPYWKAGGFMALWVIGYGAVQAAAPFLLRGKSDPTGSTATKLAFFLALIPAGMAAALYGDLSPSWVVIVGLILFGIVFALNSAVHSYLILAYTDRDKVALDVGIYYMANAGGRLAGTILSGWLYQIGIGSGSVAGILACLVASAVFLILTFGISFALPRKAITNGNKPAMNIFERHLTLWVGLCILAGIGLGKLAPDLAKTLDGMSLYVGGAPVVSIPIAICLFFMMYPIMVKIDFGEVVKAGRNPKPVMLTLIVNWGIKPFTMLAIATLFLGGLFKDFLPGTEIVSDGTTVELYRSYISGAILLGIAPCTAMVLVWSYLAKGNQGHTLVMVAVNSLTMLFLYGLLGGWLLGINKMPVPWEALLLSVGVYVALPLIAGYFSRLLIMKTKGPEWFREKFLHFLTPVSIIALLATLVLLFSFKGETILANPLTILWIAIPLTLQTVLIFAITYGLAKLFKFSYEDAAPSAMIGASNHFEVAIATAVMLFGLSSGAALATVVGVLIEVPLMLLLVRFCQRTQGWFRIPAVAKEP